MGAIEICIAREPKTKYTGEKIRWKHEQNIKNILSTSKTCSKLYKASAVSLDNSKKKQCTLKTTITWFWTNLARLKRSATLRYDALFAGTITSRGDKIKSSFYQIIRRLTLEIPMALARIRASSECPKMSQPTLYPWSISPKWWMEILQSSGFL